MDDVLPWQMDKTPRGLTLWRPWPWVILFGSKCTENRPWWRESVRGHWIALHAGKHWDQDGEARILAVHPEMPRDRSQHPSGAIVGVARVVEVVTKSDSPWFTGPYGWILQDIAPIHSVSCKGMQGLWAIPPEVLKKLRIHVDYANDLAQESGYECAAHQASVPRR
jgi:hypothetical protein